MKLKINKLVHFVSVISVLMFTPLVAWGSDPSPWQAPNQTFINVIIVFILAGIFFAVLVIRAATSGSNWSLAEALSEEADFTLMETDASGNRKPVLDSSGKQVMITELRASSSRLIAFMGMLVILLMFIGFGVFSLYSFARTGTMPPTIDKAVDYLYAGLTLFAPYVVNKFSSIFSGIAPKG